MGPNVERVLALLCAGGVSARAVAEMELPVAEARALLDSEAGRDALSTALGRSVGPSNGDTVRRQMERMTACGVDAVTCFDDEYPEALRAIPESPPILFYKGDRLVLSSPAVAVVGTRKPTPGGVAFARRLSRSLSDAGVTVVSGLARGIDTAAHRGCLAGDGATVAVIGTGIDVPYPAENAELMLDVCRRGCVVSEQWMGCGPQPHVFPRRNRLISAISLAVIVVEGGVRSGALITAKWALEQGRDVGAVPGFPGDFRSQGPNQLLRQGAFLVESARDVFDALPRLSVMTGSVAPTLVTSADATKPPDGDKRRVLDALGTRPATADDIARTIEMEVERVERVLFSLELDGRIQRDAAGRAVRTVE